MLVRDGFWHVRHGNRFKPAQAAQLTCRVAQAIEDHGADQCFGVKLPTRGAKRTLAAGDETRVGTATRPLPIQRTGHAGSAAPFSAAEISFKTIHASKGLEAKHVILLNADSGRTGFPSEIVDDPLLSLVSPEEGPFHNAEERRVMYVAMTRARHTLTILASNARPSAFVTELRKDPAYGIVKASGGELEEHVCGECGGRFLGVTGQDGRIRYRYEHIQHCGNLLPACQSCGTELPRQADGTSEVRCGCGACYPTCPACKDGWLVERGGIYGKFLSCVRYPTCTGKPKATKAGPADRATLRRRRPE
jgi:DNA helicase-4